MTVAYKNVMPHKTNWMDAAPEITHALQDKETVTIIMIVLEI